MATYAAAPAKTISTTDASRYCSPAAVPLSMWARSRAKRWFDIALVVAALPVVIPLCLLICLAIRFSSRGPVFFRQIRIGKHGKPFSIVKFRTMHHGERSGRGLITTIEDRRITSVGRLLRYWKLDELPQLLNVLRGEMSLVGPRPRVPGQPIGRVDCLPGITGAASLVFAREERLLARIPHRDLDTYYARRVIPAKQHLDNHYMARATFFSDMGMIILSVCRICFSAEDDLPFAIFDRDTRGEIRQVLPEECRD